MRFLSIQGIGQYNNFQSNYRINDIPRVNIDEIKNTETAVSKDTKNLTPDSIIESNVSREQQKDVNPNEISIIFNKNDDFSYIGRDKELESLDIERAISDMRQDSILQEYQYFVGSASNIYHSEDGTVLAKF